jgi:hypothetical protein
MEDWLRAKQVRCDPEEVAMNKARTKIFQVGAAPYPAGATESTLSMIAKRASGGKLAVVERGSKQALIVQMSDSVGDVATCDVVDVEEEKVH